LHANMEQKQRLKNLEKFNGQWEHIHLHLNMIF
jgi:hypothetical protein